MNRSQIFSVYNKAKSNKALETLDKARVNRALGYLLSKDQSWRTKYQPTVKSCRCPDRSHGHTCKHMIAVMIETRWSLDEAEKKEKARKVREQALPVQVRPRPTGVCQKTSDGGVCVAIQKVGSYDLHLFPSEEEFKRYMRLFGFDGTVVRPGKTRGRRGHTIQHGYDEWMEN